MKSEEPEIAYELPQFDTRPQLKIEKMLEKPKVGVETQKYEGNSSLFLGQ